MLLYLLLPRDKIIALQQEQILVGIYTGLMHGIR